MTQADCQYCIATQILTIEEFLHGAEVKMPPHFGTFKQAQKIGKQAEAEQAELGFGEFYHLPLALVIILKTSATCVFCSKMLHGIRIEHYRERYPHTHCFFVRHS